MKKLRAQAAAASWATGLAGVLATGTLTILDATREVSLPISDAVGIGVQIAGALPLNMTTYGVEPPVVVLGLMRVRPQTPIEFTGDLTP